MRKNYTFSFLEVSHTLICENVKRFAFVQKFQKSGFVLKTGFLRLMLHTLFVTFATSQVSEEVFAWELSEQNFLSGVYAQPENSSHAGLVASYYSAEIRHYPPDAAKKDTRLEGLFSAKLSRTFGKTHFRPAFVAKHVSRSEMDETPPENAIKSSTQTFDVFANIGFQPTSDFEVFGGAQVRFHPEFVEKTTGVTNFSEKKRESAILISPQFGLQKRAGWVGGFYFSMLAEQKSKYKHTASDGSFIEGNENLFLAPRWGGFFEVPIQNMKLLAEATLVRAGETASETESEIKAFRDHYQILVSYLIPTAFAGVRTTILHRTLSYGEQGFIDVDLIPVTQFEVAFELGSSETKPVLGLGYLYGSDGQSLPEFNAQYTIHNFSARLGFDF